MPQKSQRDKIGTSPSTVIRKVTQNSVDGQMPVPVGTATTKGKEYAKQPITVPIQK